MKTRIFTLFVALVATLQLLAVNDFTVDGICYTKLGGDSVEVGENSGITGDVVIPATVTNSIKTYRVVAIGSSAFAYCSLASITIPNSVTSIEDHAFESCRNLNSVNIPNSITNIGVGAFGSCTSLTSIVLPNSVTTIDNWAFSSSGLTSITIPNSVTSIGSNVFDNTAISTPVYNDHMFIYLPSSYSGVVIIPDGITTLVPSVFSEHIYVTNVILPSSLHKIGESAFYNCRNISSIIIPEKVDTIGYHAFNGCVDLADVYVNAVEPPYIGWESFTSNPVIHLACGVNSTAYKSNNFWNNYSLEYPVSNYTLTLMCNEVQGTINTIRALACNNDTAVIYAQANAGYHFTNWSDGNNDNPRTVIMTQDKTLYANFAVSLYTFTATTEDAAKGTVTANNGMYQYGTELTMTATPAEHYTFDHWDLQFSAEEAISADEAYEIASSLAAGEESQQVYTIYGYVIRNYYSYNNSYYLGSTPESAGNFLVYRALQSANIGDLVLVRSTLTNYKGTIPETVDGKATIQVIASPKQNPATVTIAGNLSAIAIFSKEKHSVCFNWNNYYCELHTDNSGFENCQGLEYGASITATVVPYNGFVFQQWSDGNTDNPRTFTVADDISIEAICIRDQCILTLTPSDEEVGRVFGTGTYDKNTSVQIFAIPNSGYDFIGWSDNNTTNPRYIYLDENEISLTANFEITSSAQYIVDVTAQNPAQGSASATNYVRLDAVPADGCTFVRWSDGNTDNPRYMELNADIELQAIFDGIPSGVEDPSSAPKGSVRKVVINGNMYIIKDAGIYTTTGQEVK